MLDANQDSSTLPTDDAIRNKAYDLWIEEGKPDGKHDEHWHRARESLAPTEADSAPEAPPIEQPAGSVAPIRKARKSAGAA